MASDSGARAVNGNYGSVNSYGSADQQLPSHGTATGSAAPAPGSTGADASSAPNTVAGNSTAPAEGSSSVPKDEVGWYFVEQYYTTLSKNPEKLHVRRRSVFAPSSTVRSHGSSSSTTSAPNSCLELRRKRFPYLWDNAFVVPCQALYSNADCQVGDQRTNQRA